MLDRPPPGPLRETGLIKTPSTGLGANSGHSHDNTRETQLHATAGPSALQPFTKDDDDSDSAEEERVESSGSTDYGSSMTPDQEYGGDLPPEVTQCLLDSVALNQLSPPQDTDADCITCKYSSTVHTAGSGEDELSSVPSECEAGGDSDALEPGSSCLPRSHSVPSLSQISSAENKTFRPSESLPDLLLKSSFEEFTPDVTVDENDETYRFLCSCPGLYQCSVTGLVFHMEGEGDVVYRIVSWDRRLLAQHHKKPAGPLFDIKCLQQSVCRLHLPHCEIRSTAGCGFLSVAHVKDESIEFIPPHKITETHVIINITGFSGFGNVKDEDSPLVPVRALVLLFYRPLNELTSLLNVLMLPGNAVLRNVRRTRKSLVGDELYIETSSHCKLLPKQEYTLSTCPEDDSVLVQPTTAEFDCDNYDNYIPSFQVRSKTIMLNMKTLLRETNSSHAVWEREVCLPSAGVKRPCVQGSSDQRLKEVRSSFIEGISGPVLKSLLDKLFEQKVLTDPEREEADVERNRGDKARVVIDTVRRKGEAASSEMIEFLCELDPFLCEHLGLV
ncbi:caspase recruitment domain-containing protein 8-like [Pagrus major]|uniref:caspase recruitment domain-containing protein 8-like n=1 Tax=Pagrus major TaxID=143350 RepID=UPI003CC87877